MGTREGVANKIEAETKVKIEEMNTMVQQQQEAVSYFVYFRIGTGCIIESSKPWTIIVLSRCCSFIWTWLDSLSCVMIKQIVIHFSIAVPSTVAKVISTICLS